MIYLIILLFIILIVGGVYKLYQERKMNDYLLASLDQHISEVQSMYEQMRGIKHDYVNQLQILKTHSQNENYKDLSNYVNEMEHELNQVDTIVMSGNIVIDALVNSKLTLAKNQGIHLSAKAISPQKLSISDLDLGILIGNILSNAYESALKTDTKFIRFYLAPIKGNLYISCSNSVKGKVSSFLSSKGDAHGYGIKRIDSVVEKYNGWSVRASEDGVFVSETHIPLKD